MLLNVTNALAHFTLTFGLIVGFIFVIITFLSLNAAEVKDEDASSDVDTAEYIPGSNSNNDDEAANGHANAYSHTTCTPTSTEDTIGNGPGFFGLAFGMFTGTVQFGELVEGLKSGGTTMLEETDDAIKHTDGNNAMDGGRNEEDGDEPGAIKNYRVVGTGLGRISVRSSLLVTIMSLVGFYMSLLCVNKLVKVATGVNVEFHFVVVLLLLLIPTILLQPSINNLGLHLILSRSIASESSPRYTIDPTTTFVIDAKLKVVERGVRLLAREVESNKQREKAVAKREEKLRCDRIALDIREQDYKQKAKQHEKRWEGYSRETNRVERGIDAKLAQLEKLENRLKVEDEWRKSAFARRKIETKPVPIDNSTRNNVTTTDSHPSTRGRPSETITPTGASGSAVQSDKDIIVGAEDNTGKMSRSIGSEVVKESERTSGSSNDVSNISNINNDSINNDSNNNGNNNNNNNDNSSNSRNNNNSNNSNNNNNNNNNNSNNSNNINSNNNNNTSSSSNNLANATPSADAQNSAPLTPSPSPPSSKTASAFPVSPSPAPRHTQAQAPDVAVPAEPNSLNDAGNAWSEERVRTLVAALEQQLAQRLTEELNNLNVRFDLELAQRVLEIRTSDRAEYDALLAAYVRECEATMEEAGRHAVQTEARSHKLLEEAERRVAVAEKAKTDWKAVASAADKAVQDERKTAQDAAREAAQKLKHQKEGFRLAREAEEKLERVEGELEAVKRAREEAPPAGDQEALAREAARCLAGWEKSAAEVWQWVDCVEGWKAKCEAFELEIRRLQDDLVGYGHQFLPDDEMAIMVRLFEENEAEQQLAGAA